MQALSRSASGCTSMPAPASASTIPRLPSGRSAPMTGRRTPRTRPTSSRAAASVAPVEPAETKPAASPRATRPAATRTLAAALLEVGRVRGVRRPVIGALLPLGKRGIVLADAGAGMDVQPEALRESACMARAYARALGVRRPTIGLLNVGAERPRVGPG